MGEDGADDHLITVALLLAADTVARMPLAKAMDAIGGCPRGKEGEIVICRRGDRAQPYRIPEALRDQGFDYRGSIDSVSRERNRLIEPGAGGVLECSNVGTAGHAGCQIRTFRAAKEQKGGR